MAPSLTACMEEHPQNLAEMRAQSENSFRLYLCSVHAYAHVCVIPHGRLCHHDHMQENKNQDREDSLAGKVWAVHRLTQVRFLAPLMVP